MRKFLLVGRTGVGKSSFINSAFGNHISQTSEFEACTKTVEYYAQNTSFGNICLIDTPGLAEDDKPLDEKYLDLIQTAVNLKEIEAIIYVTRLNETRFRPDEKRTLRLLSNHLNSRFLNDSWLVLTFAASVPNDVREEVAQKRIEHIESFLQKITEENRREAQFQKFSLTILVDNVVDYWTEEAVPILSILEQYST